MFHISLEEEKFTSMSEKATKLYLSCKSLAKECNQMAQVVGMLFKVVLSNKIDKFKELPLPYFCFLPVDPKDNADA